MENYCTPITVLWVCVLVAILIYFILASYFLLVNSGFSSCTYFIQKK